MNVVQLSGSQSAIIRVLDHVVPLPAAQSPVAQIKYIDGAFYGVFDFYKCHAYPAGYVGPVEFMWQQRANEADCHGDVCTAESIRLVFFLFRLRITLCSSPLYQE